MTRLSHEAYVDHLARETARFAEALGRAATDARVPTCPDWAAEDLRWHLAEVQWFWAQIVSRHAQDDEQVEKAKPARPVGATALRDLGDRAGRDLVAALAASDPGQSVWTWASEQSAGWVARRQAHEALVHRLDAELTVGTRTLFDPALAADGVDEALRVMFGGAPAWGTLTSAPERSVRVRSTDTGHTWLLRLGRFIGTSPTSGTVYDEPAFDVTAVDDGSPAAATVTGTAADLDCVLWNRPPVSEVTDDGDRDVLAGFRQVIAAGVQ